MTWLCFSEFHPWPLHSHNGQFLQGDKLLAWCAALRKPTGASERGSGGAAAWWHSRNGGQPPGWTRLWSRHQGNSEFFLFASASSQPGERVAQRKSTRYKSRVKYIRHGHYMEEQPLCARLCAHPDISLESDSVQTLPNSFRWDCKLRSPVCMCMQKDHMHRLKILESMLQLGRLWKH